jgi:type I restriction enzyme R subunit
VRSSQEEVIAKINDLFSGDHPDSGVRNVVTHVRDRLEDSETVTQQAQRNSLAQFSASPDPPSAPKAIRRGQESAMISD